MIPHGRFTVLFYFMTHVTTHDTSLKRPVDWFVRHHCHHRESFCAASRVGRVLKHLWGDTIKRKSNCLFQVIGGLVALLCNNLLMKPQRELSRVDGSGLRGGRSSGDPDTDDNNPLFNGVIVLYEAMVTFTQSEEKGKRKPINTLHTKENVTTFTRGDETLWPPCRTALGRAHTSTRAEQFTFCFP